LTAGGIATVGEGRWQEPDEGEFTYIGFHVDDIIYNADRLALCCPLVSESARDLPVSVPV